MDRSSSLVQTACQGIFIIIVTIFSLSWLLGHVKKYYSSTSKDSSVVRVAETEPDPVDGYRSQQDECRQRMQEEHETKVSHHKERVLKQQEARRMKKEKDFYQFLSPGLLTEGIPLGGTLSGSDDSDGDVPEGRRAAHRRRPLEQINERLAAEIAATTTARQKPKRVIWLPQEPDVDEDRVITVMLRSPIGSVCQRRFYVNDSIQCLLDYMTSQGFSQTRYTVCTSYPRTLLDNPQLSFLDYNLGHRVALHIEDKD